MARALLCCLALLLFGSPCFADDVGVVQGAADGSEFVFVTAGTRALVIPKTVLFLGEPSFILQKRRLPGQPPSYVLTATFTYKLDTDAARIKNAATAAGINPNTATAVPILNYTTYLAVWNVASSKFDQRKIDGGTINPAGTMASSFAIDLASAEAVRTLVQNPHAISLLLDLQMEVQVIAPRDTKAVDDLIEKELNGTAVATVMPGLNLLKDLQSRFRPVVGSNPGYAAEAISKAINGYSLSLDTLGRPVYSAPASNAPSNPNTNSQIRMIDRIAASLSLDLCGDPNRLKLMDIGKTGCSDLDELLQRR